MNTLDGGAGEKAPTQDLGRWRAERDVRSIIESGAALLWLGAPDGTRRWVGHALSKFTGRAQADLAGARWLEALHPEDAERCAAIDLACLSADQRYTLDYRLRCHDGRYVWIMDSASPSHDDAGVFNGHIGVCVDIDDRRKVEDDLAERMRKLRITGRL